MLGAQEVPASGTDVVQGGIEFLITPSTVTSRKVLPAGPAQVTIRGVGQSYPISVDCRSTATSRDFLLFAGWTRIAAGQRTEPTDDRKKNEERAADPLRKDRREETGGQLS
ncbi:hypothetical protein DBV15_10358 [Temnothorax longispinosus]|uniref:Uncharacterized protein n=1 Tax=Temnothorax longispinosus TaxID=300112 RepID=A0A4S2KXC7_9HYME|nr:hypothetical protein DBV15_10358 [Temnothorax longispinosus]